ncbi:MAG: hypothetical protein ALECFALPRED_004177 [Alectoria fallacina]|uniref:RING-type domain-containing protein n=1 Tax=Alectoria fallacina TaxID=1903189 RepID=A0A8H3FMX0_9LECA|nr:MAG: hypothetical protein ALECFALPRED_004177 [Alectoria fallacina]
MASATIPHFLLALCLSLLTASPVSAQTVAPSNATANDSVQFVMTTTLNGMPIKPQILPLTNGAGLSGTLSQLEQIVPQGPLVLTTTKSVESLQPGDIAYISCEPSDYTGDIDATKTINLAVNNKPYAIVLYSEYAATCTFSPSGDFQYLSMYTMQNASSSAAVVDGLQKNDPPYPQTTIALDQQSANGTNNSGSDGDSLGKSPTTAVAMIILYSITGIITALFLIIIIVGAIRAHRHPERYGPRRVIGRVRQGRAKGLARAMLETLPIVKFGDKEEDDKPAEQGRDVELADVSKVAAAGTGHQEDGATTSNTDIPVESGPDVVTTEAAAGSVQPTKGAVAGAEDNTDNGLACSVCTDDFIKGQDIRVLPCKHKFHPECIDPWLLNVSGTCPLCRVDLHPTSSDTEEIEEDEADTYAVPADPGNRSSVPAETAHRHRRSRILSTLNVGRMRHATADERIEALRRLREENQATNENVDQGGWIVGERTMNRARARLSRAFGSRPASGIHVSRPTSQVPAATAPSAEAPNNAEIPATAEAHAPGAAATTSEATPSIEATPFAGALASNPR